MTRHHVDGKLELCGSSADFRVAIFSDDQTQARASVMPLLSPWPHVITTIEVERPPEGPRCIACGRTERRACLTSSGRGCSWILLDHERDSGLCSECALALGFDSEALVHAARFWRPPADRAVPLVQIIRPRPERVSLMTSPSLRVESCRSCNKPIIWMRTASGRSMPVDAGSVGSDPIAWIGERPAFNAEHGHISHFATCPNADDWRRRGTDRRRPT